MRITAKFLFAITVFAYLLKIVISFKCYVCQLGEDGCYYPKLTECTSKHVLPALLHIHDLNYIETNVSSYVGNSDEFMCLSFDDHKDNYKYCMYREVDFCNFYQLSCTTCFKEGCNAAIKMQPHKSLKALIVMNVLYRYCEHS